MILTDALLIAILAHLTLAYLVAFSVWLARLLGSHRDCNRIRNFYRVGVPMNLRPVVGGSPFRHIEIPMADYPRDRAYATPWVPSDDGTGFPVPDEDSNECDISLTSSGDLGEDVACCICKVRHRRVAAVPCGHCAYCVRCSRSYMNLGVRNGGCAVCRKPVTAMISIYN